jgi:recombination protein RecA
MSQKRELLDTAIKQIQKRFGEGVIMKLDQNEKANIPVIPTGVLSLDVAIGIGGFPRGRVVEVYGPESSGKTTIALSVIAQAQKMGGVAAFIDAEHALDPSYAQKIGVNLDELYISQPDSGEQALEITEALTRTGEVDLIVIDSVAALVPKAEIEGNMGDSQIGLQARLMSQALRKITGVINKSKTCIIFINQLRMKIGGYGNPETTTGGMALKFYSSIRLEVRKGESLKQKDEIYGHLTKIKVAKNKMAAPFKKTEFVVLFNKGPYNISSVVDEAVKLDIIRKSGTWYYYGDEKLGQGKDNAYLFLEENPEIALKIENQIREHFELPVAEAPKKPKKAEEGEEEKPKKKGGRKPAAKKEKEELEEELL